MSDVDALRVYARALADGAHADNCPSRRQPLPIGSRSYSRPVCDGSCVTTIDRALWNLLAAELEIYRDATETTDQTPLDDQQMELT